MDTLRFEIHPDIRQAEMPPARLYTDAEVYERQKERVFGRSWLFACALDALADGPAIAPFQLLDGSLSESLLLTRDEKGQVRMLSNVCTHRGALVAEFACRATSLACGYHGRRFALDGTFRSAPEFESLENFPTQRDDLRRLPVERLGPLVFTALEPRHGFDQHAGDLCERLAWLPFDRLRWEPERTRTYEFDANWALYCDNFLEGFHIPFVHPRLNARIEFATYTTELQRNASVQIAIAKPGEPAFEPPRESPDHGRRIAGYYAWLFPNLMLNFYPWGLSLNVVEPLAVGRTRVRFLAFTWNRELLDHGAGSALDEVEMEDEAIVCSVQRGLRSRLYQRGRYSPTREQGVHHFHRLLAEALA